LDFVIGGLESSFGGAVGDDDESSDAGFIVDIFGFVLSDAADGDAVFTEDMGDIGEYAWAIGDGEAEVVFAGEFFSGLELKRGAIAESEHGLEVKGSSAGGAVDEVCNDSGGGGELSGTCAGYPEDSEGIAFDGDEVICAAGHGDGSSTADEGGADGGFESAVCDAGGGEEFDAIAEICGDDEVEEFDAADALEDDLINADVCSEGESYEDGEFLCGVDAIDIHGGVRFGIAQLLSFEEDSFVGLLFIEHTAEDEVAGAVEDGFDGEDSISGESGIDSGDNGDAAGDSGFEGDGALGQLCGVEEFVAVFVEECLVCGDDIFSGAEEAEDLGASGFDAADDVYDGVDFGVIQQGLEVVGDGDAGEIHAAMEFRPADDDVFESDWASGLCGE
jgi:hypothetical protein